MPIVCSYYGTTKPTKGTKPLWEGPPDKLPFGQPNPIDWMTGKRMVQLRRDKPPGELILPAEEVPNTDEKVKVSAEDDTAEYLADKVAHSVVAAGDGKSIHLDGDAAAPGAAKVYGTDSEGAKGWRDAPASVPDGTATGQLLVWNQTEGEWQAPAVGSLATNDMLKWDGSKWVATTLSVGRPSDPSDPTGLGQDSEGSSDAAVSTAYDATASEAPGVSIWVCTRMRYDHTATPPKLYAYMSKLTFPAAIAPTVSGQTRVEVEAPEGW